jgi:hypothetical protein
VTYIIFAVLPALLAAMGTLLAIVWAHLTVSTTYAPEAYGAWDDVLADVEAAEVDADWLDLITDAHEEEDLWDRMLSNHEADTVDAGWLATIEVAHVALDVLYCTMGASAVAPRLRYAKSVPAAAGRLRYDMGVVCV